MPRTIYGELNTHDVNRYEGNFESLTDKNARIYELKRLQEIVSSAIKAIAPNRRDLVSYVKRDPASLLHDHDPVYILPSAENTIDSKAEKLATDYYALIHTTGDDFKEKVKEMRHNILTGVIPLAYRDEIPYERFDQEGVKQKIEVATLQFATGEITEDDYRHLLSQV